MRVTIALAFLLFALPAAAQKEANIWYFSHRAGLDFNGNAPRPLTDGQVQNIPRPPHAPSLLEFHPNSAVRSDRHTGHLLFYSNGQTVWNRHHQAMPNAQGLWGNANTDQGVLIVPVPNQEQQYYLFTVSSVWMDDPRRPSSTRLHYSLVDLRLDGGRGDIVSGTKNTLLADNLAQRLTAVPHANGRDYWLLTQGLLTDDFHVYPVAAGGVGEPLIQRIGSPRPAPADSVHERPWGHLKASPDGTLLAAAQAGRVGQHGGGLPFDLFDFDAATGRISNHRSLGEFSFQHGVSFSPDNTKLYLKGYHITEDDYDVLHQFDLLAQDVPASRVGLLLTNPLFDPGGRVANFANNTLELAPDGRIYSGGMYHHRDHPSERDHIVIERPNEAGVQCGVRVQPFDYGEGRATLTLPNFIQSTFNHLTPTDNPNILCDMEEALTLYPNPTDGLVRVRLPGSCFAPFSLSLYNAVGQLVATRRVEKADDAELDLRHLAAGVYACVATFPDRRMVRRVVKAH